MDTGKAAVAGGLIGLTAGTIKGGSIGIAAFGGAIGVPLVLTGVVVGTAGSVACYGAYKLFKNYKITKRKG